MSDAPITPAATAALDDIETIVFIITIINNMFI